jgi:hypothetical protein
VRIKGKKEIKFIMKKKISLFVASVITMVALPVAAFAAPTTTDVNGQITNNGHGVKGAKVVVVCGGHSAKTTSGAGGGYEVTFTAKQCPDGKLATVVATKNGLGGTSSSTVKNFDATDNVAIVNVNLPEFGFVAGIGAAVIGAGAFLAVRRRQISGHEA